MPLDTARPTRRFSVHGQADAPSRGRLVEGASFEDAALGFVETFHPAAETEDAVTLIVEDCATGERQCFRIDLETGETAPCD
jgi:hypothetical protein